MPAFFLGLPAGGGPAFIEKNFRKPLFIAYYSDICNSEKMCICK